MHSPPPEGGVRLFVRRVGDDDPRLCTGRRLLRLGLAGAAPSTFPRGRSPILLDPYARDPVSKSDRPAAVRGGLLAIDCSWNRLGAAGRFEPALAAGALRRRLPWLLAANPQHFGRPTQLNTAEALAAGLWLLGEPDRARSLIEPFPGGRGFFPLNEETLRAYDAAVDAAGVREAERRRFGGATEGGTPPLPSADGRRGSTPVPPVG